VLLRVIIASARPLAIESSLRPALRLIQGAFLYVVLRGYFWQAGFCF